MIILGFTIASSLLLMPDASASALLYGLDFNDLSHANQTITNQGSGSTTVEIIQNGNSKYLNYGPSSAINIPRAIDDGGNYHSPYQGTFSISNNSGINGMDLSTGFSIGIHLYASASWQDAFSFTIGGATLRVEMGNNNTWFMYGGGDLGISGNDTTLFQGTASQWNHLGLTFKGNQIQVFQNGNLVNTLTTTLSDTSLITEIKGGGSQKLKSAGNVLVDNLAVYEGVLNADDFAYLSSHNMPLTIPEPATTSLSLLGLMALMTRHRI